MTPDPKLLTEEPAADADDRPHFPQLPDDLDPIVAAEINDRRRERVISDILTLEAKGRKLAEKAHRQMMGRPARRRPRRAYLEAMDCFVTANALKEMLESLPPVEEVTLGG